MPVRLNCNMIFSVWKCRMSQNSLIQIFVLRRKLHKEQQKNEQLEQELWDTRQAGPQSPGQLWRPFHIIMRFLKGWMGFCVQFGVSLEQLTNGTSQSWHREIITRYYKHLSIWLKSYVYYYLLIFSIFSMERKLPMPMLMFIGFWILILRTTFFRNRIWSFNWVLRKVPTIPAQLGAAKKAGCYCLYVRISSYFSLYIHIPNFFRSMDQSFFFRLMWTCRRVRFQSSRSSLALSAAQPGSPEKERNISAYLGTPSMPITALLKASTKDAGDLEEDPSVSSLPRFSSSSLGLGFRRSGSLRRDTLRRSLRKPRVAWQWLGWK